MKKPWILIGVMLFIPLLSACNQGADEGINTDDPPKTIKAKDLDAYLFDPDWQLVDLRGFDELAANGWIRGFESIPYYQSLEQKDILVRTDGWNYTGSQIKDAPALRALFDEDKNIILICRAGVRAAFVKTALEDLGYDNVWNVGAISDYEGSYFMRP